MRVLLLTPPLTDLHTPYPATAYLTGFLRGRGYDVFQADIGMEVATAIFSRRGLEEVFAALDRAPVPGGTPKIADMSVRFVSANRDRYLDLIEPAVRFLRGKDPSLANRICSGELLPRSPRLMAAMPVGVAPGIASRADPLSPVFGTLGLDDRARHLVSLMLADIEQAIRLRLDPKFNLAAYGSRLAKSAATFEPIEQALLSSDTIVDRHMERLTEEHLKRVSPEAVGLTIPFPGNLYGAFRIARWIRKTAPHLPIMLGGGFVNCKLRNLEEPRVFDYVDFISFDDGEQPILSILEHLAGKRSLEQLLRTMVRQDGRVVLKSDPGTRDVPFVATGTPSWVGLDTDLCIPTLVRPDPMTRLAFGARWNKLTAAHGCYWKQCTFCDISLDYVGKYEPASADLLVDRVESVIAETGLSGFHFVDEAAPPALLKAFAERLLTRRITISWWGNIRFDKTFTPELTRLLARAGCIAVTGGLEVASDRLLAQIKKGVTVAQVARVTKAFADSGVVVHAYLMYGYPSQTEQETIDSAEIVRQLFMNKCLHSGFWHRFFATAHSPVGMDPGRFGIELKPMPTLAPTFASYEVPFIDPHGCDPGRFTKGLEKSLEQYKLGAGLERDVRTWLSRSDAADLPPTTIAPDFIAKILMERNSVSRPTSDNYVSIEETVPRRGGYGAI